MPLPTPERFEELSKLREEKERTAALAKDAKAEFERAQYELFEDMREINMEGTKINGVRFDRKTTIYGTVQDRHLFYDWCKEQGLLEDYFSPKEEKARVNELVRQRMNDEEPLPPGVSSYPKDYISVTNQGG